MERLQSPTGDSEPAFNLQWNSLYDLSDRSIDETHDGQVRFSLRYTGTATDDPTIKILIADLSIDPDLPDSRATWHRNYTPLAPWIRAHVLKLAMGWNGEKQLADHFKKHPELAATYGFVGDDLIAQSETVRPNPPAQSRLWEMWHKEFDDEL